MTLDAQGHQERRKLIREGTDPTEAFKRALEAQDARKPKTKKRGKG